MEIGVSQSIFTQKNTSGSTGPGYSSTTTWDILGNHFQIFLDVETIFTLLGFQVFLFSIFYPFSLLILDIYHQPTPGWIIHPDMISIRNSYFGILNKSHIGVESTKLLFFYCHCVLLVYNFQKFEERKKLKMGIWISPSMYISR